MAEDSSTDPRTELTPIKPKVLRWSMRTSTRLKVFAVWIFFAVLHLISRSETTRHLFEFFSAGSLALLLSRFVLGPYRLYTKGSQPLRSNYRIFTGTIPDLPKYRVEDLAGLGFQPAGQLVKDGAKNVSARVAVFVHPSNQDSAQLALVVSGLRTTSMLIFKSRFDDGFAFETSDSNTAPIFAPDPKFPVFRFPPLRSTRDLYRIHRKLKEQFVVNHRPILADSEGELSEFMSREEIARQRYLNGGSFKLAPNGDRFIYTWRGAIRNSYLTSWPVKQLRELGLGRKAMKMADELGLPIHPKLGCLMESLRQGHSTREQ